MVDEFQDLDLTQYCIVKLLAQGHRSLFAVGDDEQSIFSWRGADPRVMARFASDFGIEKPILLDINCRCTKAICETARKVLPPGEILFGKQITAIRESDCLVRLVEHANDAEESAWLVADLRTDLLASGLPRGEYAILYRKHETGQRLEQSLIGAGIPCQMGRDRALSDDPVMSQLIASLRIALQPSSDVNIEDLASKVFPHGFVAELRQMPGDAFFDKLRTFARQHSGPSSSKCWRFLYQVENLKGLMHQCEKLEELVDAILAHGIGQYENALERCHEKLEDPDSLATARELGSALNLAVSSEGTVYVTPAGGLEIAVKIMLQQAMPSHRVRYLEPAAKPERIDVIIDLGAGLVGTHEGQVVKVDAPGRLRITRIFKALQFVESRRYRKTFADYVAFDLETTGKDVEQCEIVEIAGVKVRDGQVADQFRSLIRCQRPISAAATAIHGYTDADVKDQPTFEEVWRRFRSFVGDHVLVAHNGHQFDIPVLRRLVQDQEEFAGLAFFDTLILARSLFPTGSLRLSDLAARFGIEPGRGHHALDDSVCLARVFERLQEERLARSRKTCLANILEGVALGAAIEAIADLNAEDR